MKIKIISLGFILVLMLALVSCTKKTIVLEKHHDFYNSSTVEFGKKDSVEATILMIELYHIVNYGELDEEARERLFYIFLKNGEKFRTFYKTDWSVCASDLPEVKKKWAEYQYLKSH